MASEYSVNIKLNTEQVRKDLKDIKTDIDKLGKVNLGTNKKTQKTESQILDSKRAQQDMMSKTRRIGDLVQKQADQGLKVGRAQEAITKSALLNQKKDFVGSEKLLKVAMNELKVQKSISKEIAQQTVLKTRLASKPASIPKIISSGPTSSLTSLGGGTPLGLRGGPTGPVQAFPQTGDLGMFGPKLPFIGQTSGFGRSSLRGNRFQFGSQAQIEYSGKGMGRVPIGGRPDLVGSLPNLNRVAKDNAMPVKGFEFMPGTPAYFEKFNKDITRIAKSKGNVLPVGGMKHLVGSPAYFKDQAKQLKKLRGGPTGFSAAQYGPQQLMQGPRMFGQAGPAFDLTGQSSPLNFDSRKNLLPGRMGSRQTRTGLRRTLARNRGPALQSAAISGAFPLLFGQGPLAAAGGAIGGGLGGAFGGQMGGFAGGLIGTSIVSGIQGFVTSIKELGSALDPVSGNATQAIQALGFIGTARAREIGLIEKTVGKQAALNKVREELIKSVGAKETLALQESANVIKKAQQSIASSFTDLKANTASFLKDITSGSVVEKSLAERGAAANPNLGISKQFQLNKQATNSIQLRGIEALQAGFVKPTGFLGSGTPRLTKKGKDRLKELEDEKRLLTVRLRSLGIQDKVKELVKSVNADFKEQITVRQTSFDLEQRVLNFRKEGVNPVIAKELALLGKINEDTILGLQDQIRLREEVLKDITDPLKKSVAQDEINGLKNGLKLLKDQNAERMNAVKNTMELNMKTELVQSSAEKLKDTLVTDLGEGIKGLIRGTSTLNDVLNNVLNKMIDAAFNMALFGNFGGSFMPGLGLLGSIFRADGGPVKAGGSYIVGERGPELFTPGVSGNITPNESLGGSTNIVVNVDASGSSVEGDGEKSRELGQMLSAAIQSELIKQKRPGGLLT